MLATTARRRAPTGLLLVAAGLWASGSSFVLFALAARRLDGHDLGVFATVLALSAVAVQLADSGAGLLTARDALAEPVRGAALLREGWWRRLAGTAALLPVVGVLAAVLSGSPLVGLLAAAVCAGSSLYGYSLVVEQALRRLPRMAGYQLANGLLFVGLGVLATRGATSLLQLLGATAGAYAVLVLAFVLLRPGVACRPARPPRGRDRERRRMGLGAVAATVTGNADTLALGLVSPTGAAVYASAQRPAFGIAALNNAVSTYAMTHLAGQPQRVARTRRVLPLLCLLPVLGGALALPVGRWLLPLVYDGSALLVPWQFAVLVGAYLLGTVIAVSSAALLAERRGDAVGTAGAAQAALVGGLALPAAWLGGPAAVVVLVLLGRLLVLVLHGAAHLAEPAAVPA